MPNHHASAVLRRCTLEMERLRDGALAVERALGDDIGRVDAAWRASARNLAHYVALRSFDLRDLQRPLAALGLSSLGRAEAHTLASIEAVLATLARIGGRMDGVTRDLPVDFEGGPALLEGHARALLGAPPAERTTHVMVTMPAEAAGDADLVRALVRSGMDCARINAAHDDPDVWERIARHTRAAAQSLGRPCRVLVDLSGPKLRTAPFPPGPRALHLKPERSPRGEPLRPSRVLFVSGSEHGAPEHDVRLPLGASLLERAAAGDTLALRDLRGRRRELVIAGAGPGWCLADLLESVWLETGLEIGLVRGGDRLARATVGPLPAVETPLVLRPGDALWLVSAERPARPASPRGPAQVGCTLAEVFRDARAGEPIHFDDGKISGLIRAVVAEGPDAPRLEIEITACAPGGGKLRGDKGINLPRTRLALPALTAADREVLRSTARWADLIGMSFLHEPEDVLELQRCLAAFGRRDNGIVLKIETVRAFQNLPRSAPDRHALAAPGRDGRARRPGRGARIRAPGRGPGGDPVVVRGRPRARHLGHAGAREPGQVRAALARRGHRRGHGRARRVRHAEQGPARAGGRALPGRRPAADAGTSAEEVLDPAPPLGLRSGRRRRARGTTARRRWSWTRTGRRA